MHREPGILNRACKRENRKTESRDFDSGTGCRKTPSGGGGLPTSTQTTTAAPAAEMTSKRVLKTALFMGSAKTVVPPWGGPPAPET